MDVVWIIFLFAFGGCVGSFLNVVIYRMPRGMSIAWPGSHCPGCGVAIKWYDNIPILSWLVLRAKCRSCGTRISARYVLIELLTAVLVAGLYVCLFLLGMREGIDDFTRQWPLYLSWAVLICGLIACSAVDLELFIVPLPVMWFCAAVGILAAGMFPSAFAGRASENGDRIVALMPTVSPPVAAATLAACVGLVIAKVLLHYGFLQESFVDADDRPAPTQPALPAPTNPWVEALREFLYIVPAAALGIAAYLLIRHSQWLGDVLRARMADRTLEPLVSRIMVFAALAAAVVIATLWTRLARAVGDRLLGKSPFARTREQAEEPQVAYTSAHGVNPRL